MNGAAKNGISWIGVDWGTTHLRAWIFDAHGQLVDSLSSDDGMGHLTHDRFEGALLALIGGYLRAGEKMPVICCGMAGSRQGWAEAPYAAAPCPPPGAPCAVHVATSDPRIDVRILPGVKQEKPADVMRGEETQIAGYLARDPGFDGVLCLPGTHTKWVHISAGEIVSFRTYMTGEIFAFLSEKSVLRHGMSQGGWDDPAFREAMDDALSHPQECAGALFQLRAERLLFDLPDATARARLSGTLVGLEFAAARPYWLGRRLVVIGTPALTRIYLTACAQVGVNGETADGDAMTIAGLSAAQKSITECQT